MSAALQRTTVLAPAASARLHPRSSPQQGRGTHLRPPAGLSEPVLLKERGALPFSVSGGAEPGRAPGAHLKPATVEPLHRDGGAVRQATRVHAAKAPAADDVPRAPAARRLLQLLEAEVPTAREEGALQRRRLACAAQLRGWLNAPRPVQRPERPAALHAVATAPARAPAGRAPPWGTQAAVGLVTARPLRVRKGRPQIGIAGTLESAPRQTPA